MGFVFDFENQETGGSKDGVYARIGDIRHLPKQRLEIVLYFYETKALREGGARQFDDKSIIIRGDELGNLEQTFKTDSQLKTVYEYLLEMEQFNTATEA